MCSAFSGGVVRGWPAFGLNTTGMQNTLKPAACCLLYLTAAIWFGSTAVVFSYCSVNKLTADICYLTSYQKFRRVFFPSLLWKREEGSKAKQASSSGGGLSHINYPSTPTKLSSLAVRGGQPARPAMRATLRHPCTPPPGAKYSLIIPHHPLFHPFCQDTATSTNTNSCMPFDPLRPHSSRTAVVQLQERCDRYHPASGTGEQQRPVGGERRGGRRDTTHSASAFGFALGFRVDKSTPASTICPSCGGGEHSLLRSPAFRPTARRGSTPMK